MSLPTKQALHAKIQELIQMGGRDYTRWRQRLRHALARRKWAAHGFVPNIEEFQPFFQLHDVLISKFGVPAAETKLFHVLDGITKERRRRYDVAYRGRDLTDAERDSRREQKKCTCVGIVRRSASRNAKQRGRSERLSASKGSYL